MQFQSVLPGISKRNSLKLCLPPANFSRAVTFLHAIVPATCTRALRVLTSPFFPPLHPRRFDPLTHLAPTRLCHPLSRLSIFLCPARGGVFSYASHLFVCRSLTPDNTSIGASQCQRNGNAVGVTHSVNYQSKKLPLFAQRSHDVPSESAPQIRPEISLHSPWLNTFLDLLFRERKDISLLKSFCSLFYFVFRCKNVGKIEAKFY